ncbi:tetratricopeptide (TPR) repeat protein [Saccharomonospora amisosensis]|uniref:Tetratricopeptide (TPR) repeat protein n=1 Tax=Saccharomonospora amisosensis TaxID=1128677 RepID=A0A7X5ZT27_9PSEU|nr:hypothetical protein [Saccharomonospora amisosensis]NIJ14517.1 tetratricopeptide (TPR) repeat protein [Saccharomonospora amisosensis]
MKREGLRKRYAEVAGTDLSERQAYRWVAGEVATMPYPHAQAALEQLFGEPASRLLGQPYGLGAIAAPPEAHMSTRRGNQRDDWQGQLVAQAAERARDFSTRTEATTVGTETLDQLADDVRRLTVAYQQQPLDELLSDITATQARAFGLLEGHQRPDQARELYLLVGVSSGLVAKASHDLGAPHDAMTHARAAYSAADNAGHDGLRALVRGLQALIAYWSGQLSESVRYAQRGADFAARTRGTSAVWLAASEARSLAAQGNLAEARAAIDRATEARERAYRDELDELGGLCTFNRPRQLYYAADALAWAGADEAEHAESVAGEALAAYTHAPDVDRAFGDEAGTRCALAIARIHRGQLEGAAEAVAPVLELPPAKRIHDVVTSVEQVSRALVGVEGGRTAAELSEHLHTFTSERIALPS